MEYKFKLRFDVTEVAEVKRFNKIFQTYIPDAKMLVEADLFNATVTLENEPTDDVVVAIKEVLLENFNEVLRTRKIKGIKCVDAVLAGPVEE